jgi:3-dehydroquinate synthase class II
MTLEEERLEAIKKILLEHKGKKNAIPANKISKILDIPEDDTVPTTRKLITKLITEQGMPIGAYGRGYFYIETAQELAEYMKYLDDKILQTTNRKAIVYSNYEKHYGHVTGKIKKLDDF